jgi:hypothetical protein
MNNRDSYKKYHHESIILGLSKDDISKNEYHRTKLHQI